MEKDNKGKDSTALTIMFAHDKALGQIFVDSGFFKDAKDKSQAIVKILAGREMGLQPIESMMGLDIVNGKINIGGNVMAAGIKKHPRYDYKIIEHTNEVCEIDFYEANIVSGKFEKIGTSKFTIEDAEKITYWDTKRGEKKKLIEKDNWQNYPRNMLFNRTISNGTKWYCPDVFGHSPVYTPDEMGAEDTGEDEPINVTPPPSKQPKVVRQCSECGNAIPNDNESELCALCLGSGNAIQEEGFEERPTIPPVQEAEYDDIGEEQQQEEDEEVPKMDREMEDKCGHGNPLDDCAQCSEEPVNDNTVTISIPEGIINETMKPRKVLDAIMDYATKNGLSNIVKPVIVKHYKKYDDDSRYPYHIPESKVIKIVEELTGIKTKKAEKVKKCKQKDCGKRITEPEAEEQDDLCLKCWQKEND